MKYPDEIREICEQFVEELADAEDSPELWEQWLFYIIVVLENKAMELDITHPDQYRYMLGALRDSVEYYIEAHDWS